MQIDTSNYYGVTQRSDGTIQVLMARLLAVRMLTPDQAMVHAAWLLVLADPASAVDIAGNGTRFGEIVNAILNT